jgi:lipoyl-dependent peroxiredoxin
MKALYTAHATAIGGRSGHSATSDGLLSVNLAVQKELGGPGGATNPEQLFACGYAACFGSTIEVIAKRDHDLAPQRIEVTAHVGIGQSESGGYGLTAILDVKLIGVDRARAEALAEAAHKMCPYLNATRGNMPVSLNVIFEP